MTLPNFLIIGAAKSGTTALHNYVRQHPEIYMPEKKELSFFAHHITVPSVPKMYVEEEIRTLTEYESYFDDVTTEKAIGEASPMYLYYEIASERIKSYIPDTKLIAILRNPIERAYSAYLHAVRDWREPAKDFYEALALEPKRINENWSILYHYINAGLYSKQIDRYYSQFPSENVLILFYDDLLKDPIGLIKVIFSFLKVNPNFLPDIAHHPNVSGKIRSPIFHSFMEKLFIKKNPIKTISRLILPKKIRRVTMLSMQAINMEKQKMPEEYRKHLRSFFIEDIKNLQEILGRDLSTWLN
jgi:hypothetical protein